MSTHLPATKLSEQEETFRELVRDFAQREIAPRVRIMDQAAEIDKRLIDQIFQLGLMAIEVPEEHGGAQSSLFTTVVVVEELSKVDASVAVFVDVQNTLVNNALMKWGSKGLKDKYLPLLATRTVGAYALSEAGSGSDAFALATRATKSAGGFRLTGRKLWITNGAEAGVFIVFANADPQAGYRGITAFVVDRETPGFAIGKKEDKLGIRASSTTELILDDVFIEDENVLGNVGEGYRVAIETLNEGRIGIGAQMIGIAAGALNATIAYVRERRQFGHSISDFQGVQFQLARMATDLEAARLLVYNAARLRDSGEPLLQAAAMAKLFSSEAAQRTTSDCIDLFGGNGFTREFPVEKFYCDAKIGTIYEGTSNMQLQTIAKGLLKA